MKTVLITGAAGYLGVHVSEAVGKGRSFRRVVLTDLAPSKNAPRLVAADLADPAKAHRLVRSVKPDMVIHCAGAKAEAPWETLTVAYLTTTQNILTALRASSRACRFILPSSSTVYGKPSDGSTIVTEACPLNPLTPYGKIKAAQEQLAIAAQTPKLRITVGRIFNLIGPQLPENLVIGSWARQLAAIERGLSAPVLRVGNTDRKRDFVDIRDVSRALITLGVSNEGGGIFNIGTGKTVSLQEMLRVLLQSILSPKKIKIVKAAARVRAASVDVRDLGGSPKKIHRQGWKPDFALPSSLQDTLASFR